MEITACDLQSRSEDGPAQATVCLQRTGNALNGSTLVAWKKGGETGWQLYDVEGRPSEPTGSAKSSGNGVAAVVGKDGRSILFR